MSDYSSLGFSEAMAYVVCIIVSTVMIWLLLLSIFYCDTYTGKPLAYAFLIAFCLIIAYSKIKLLIMLFPARAGLLPIQH
jgi:hypothetical protein